MVFLKFIPKKYRKFNNNENIIIFYELRFTKKAKEKLSINYNRNN